MDLSPEEVRIQFDRAMTMIVRQDHRDYAQVVSLTCGGAFREIANSVMCTVVPLNTEVIQNTCDKDTNLKCDDTETLGVTD